MAGSNTRYQHGYPGTSRESSIQSDLAGIGQGPRLQDFPFLAPNTPPGQPTIVQPSYAAVVASGSRGLQQQVRNNLSVPEGTRNNQHDSRSNNAAIARSSQRLNHATTIPRAGSSHATATQSRVGRTARPGRQRAPSATSSTHQGRRHCELPDLFYAYKPDTYRSYQHDCSLAYKDSHSFMRHSLEKHWNRGNVQREGITDDQFLMARQRVVIPGDSLSQHDRQRELWKYARRALFGISLDTPIPVCDQHVASKSKATEQEKKFHPRAIPKSTSGSSPPRLFNLVSVPSRRDHMHDIAVGQMTAVTTPSMADGLPPDHMGTLNLVPPSNDDLTQWLNLNPMPPSLVESQNYRTSYMDRINLVNERAMQTAELLSQMYISEYYFECDVQFKHIMQQTCERLNNLEAMIRNANTTFPNPTLSGNYGTSYPPSSSGTSMTYGPMNAYDNSMHTHGHYLEVPGRSQRGDASSTRS